MSVRLYKFLQETLETENQYQALLETSGVYQALLSNDLSKMDYYTPTDTNYALRQQILTKIMAKYYNYDLFTDLREYFGNRLLWRLNQIMPTYKAKFNSMLAESGYQDLWDDGVIEVHKEGDRNTVRPEKDTNNNPVNFDRTDLADSTTSITYSSDYPQVIVGSTTDYNATGDKNTISRSGNDKVTHAMQENQDYSEDITRKFTPEEIAKAKLLFAQLIFNIDEEIVRAVADLFILVDCPFEEDFDVGARMSMLADAKAYTNLKFAEAEAYTDQEVAKAKEIVYIYYADATLQNISDAVNNNKLPIIIDGQGKRWYFEQVLTGDYTFNNGIDWIKIDNNGVWTSGALTKPELYKCTYNTTTFAQITQALADDKLPYVIFPTGEYFYYYKNIDNLKYRFTESYIRETGVTYFIDVDTTNQWGIVAVNLEVTSNKVTSWGNPTSDTKYPSEKLVKDSLNNLDKVFIIDNGDTTKYAELVQAHNDGKVLICRGTASTYDEGKFYILYQWDEVNDYARFAMVDEAPWILIVETSLSDPLVWDGRYVPLQERLVDYGATPNFKTVNGTSLLGSGDVDTKELFKCTYNTTTYSEVSTAITNGKIPYVKYDNGTQHDGIYFFSYMESGVMTFTMVSSQYVYTINLASDDTWAYGSNRITELKSEQLTLLSANWDANNEQTLISTLGLTNATSIWVSPDGDPTDYASAGIYLKSVQVISDNQTATFKCTSVPSNNITVNIVRG